MPIKITVPKTSLYDEFKNEFIEIKETTLTLEHSLLSISKWESKWHIPYLSDKQKTIEQTIDYIRCMTITQNVDPEIYNYIPEGELLRIQKYIDDPMSATTISKQEGIGRSRKIITSEVIYFYMVSYNIPAEYDRWHFNRLMMLINVCNEENKPKKKMSKRDQISNYAALNAARRAKYNSRG